MSWLQGEWLSEIAHLGSVGYAGFVIFGSRTSESSREQFLAVNQQVASRLVLWHVLTDDRAKCLTMRANASCA